MDCLSYPFSWWKRCTYTPQASPQFCHLVSGAGIQGQHLAHGLHKLQRWIGQRTVRTGKGGEDLAGCPTPSSVSTAEGVNLLCYAESAK